MFFSVNSSIKILGKVYIPCVCYEVPENLKPTVNKLVLEGKAVVYDKQVFFCNGKIVEEKIAEEKIAEVKKESKPKKAVKETVTAKEEAVEKEEVEDF